jgi:hypothetical protein
MSRHPFHLPPEAWRTLATDHWERQAGVFDVPLPAPLVDEAELLEVARRVFAEDASMPVVVVDGRVINMFDPVRASLGPTPGDQTVDAYVRGTLARLGAETISYYVPNGQRHAPALWARCRALVAELLAQVGQPANKVDVDFFWGLYPATPSGIHKDSASLKYVIQGTKRMLVWPYATFEHLPEVRAKQPRYLTNHFLEDRAPLAAHRASATVLDARAGQLMYWPSDHWHIGEGQGQVVATMTIALYLADDPLKVFERAMMGFFPRERGDFTCLTVHPPPTPLGQGPAPERRAAAARLLSRFERALGDELRAVEREHVRRASGGGFDVVPPLREEVALEGCVLEGDAEFPLLVDEGPDDVAICVNGHVLLRGPLDDAARALLVALRAGTPVAFDALDEAGRAIVRHAYRARGAERVEG